MRFLFDKCKFLVISLLFLQGCAIRPVVVQPEKIYIGMFKEKNSINIDCQILSAQGVGVEFGWWHLAVGYFDHREVSVPLDRVAYCHDEKYEIWIVPSVIPVGRH